MTRYSLYFEVQKNSLPDVIGSFVDTRGLFNSHRTIRTRVNYLFLRFSKTLRNHLGQYAGDILQAIQPLLVVATPTVTSTAVLESTSDFESQLYLFEAIGYLISVVTIPDETQYQFVSMIVNPMLSRMEIILGSSMETATVVLLVCELGHIICAIGAISKGFPDFDGPSGQKKWQQPFLLTLQAINLVLQRFHSFKTVRDSTKFAIQRLSGCVGPEVLEFLPQMINSGLLGSDSSQELLEFLPFLNQIVFKFGLSVFNMMNVIWTPLRSKIGTYLQTEPDGTDERRIFLDILKAEYSLMNSMFIARISGVLFSPENISGLGATLQQVLISLSEADDMQVKKIAISLLSKMVYCWGGDPTHLELPAVAVDFKNTKAKGSAAAGVKAKENLKREPLAGFNSFIFESLVPRILTLPSSLSWKDSHGKMVGMEIALFHMTMFAVFNEIYLSLLQGNAIFANQLGGNFFEALSRRDKNDAYKYLKVYCINLRLFMKILPPFNLRLANQIR